HQNTVSPSEAMVMIGLTPTQRLEWLVEQSYLSCAKDTIIKLLGQYEQFLGATNADENELVPTFSDRTKNPEHIKPPSQFGDLMFDALNKIGAGNRFHRLLIV